MAFVNAFDPATPTDLSSAGQGDDELRLIKAALIERLSAVLDGFPDTDPVTLKKSAVLAQVDPPVTVGELAARSAPTKAGSTYYASDTDQLFVSRDSGGGVFVWGEIVQGGAAPVGVGNDADKPNPPTKAGLLWYSKDLARQYLSVDNGDSTFSWIALFKDGITVSHTFVQVVGAGADLTVSANVGLTSDDVLLQLVRYKMDVSTRSAGVSGWYFGAGGGGASLTNDSSAVVSAELKTVSITPDSPYSALIALDLHNGGATGATFTITVELYLSYAS